MKKQQSKKQLPREILKLTIDALDNEGIGLASHQRKTALVQGALPGETVLAEVEHEGRTHIYTRLRRVLRNAPQRTAQIACELEQSCLGCPLIRMKYQAQLAYKQQRVEQALGREQLLRDELVSTTLASDPPFGYRASAKLVIGRKREKVLIGLYRRGSHEIIDCPDCPVHHPLINKITAVLREEIQRQKVSVYNPQHRRGLLRYLLVRVSPTKNKALVTFVSNDRDLRQLPKLGKWLMRKVPEVIAVHQNVNSSTGNVILGQETLKLHGLPDLIDQVGDIRLRIGPEAFFQVNSLQAARIYTMVREWAQLTRKDSAIDLYCGIGGIALHLAQDAGQVYGIEYIPEAVRNAADNAELNGLKNCRFVSGDAAEELQKLAPQLKNLTLATLNPPRKGCSEELLQGLCQIRPQQIIYVSCDPDSLARDLRLLVDRGYQPVRVQPVDMFPQTSHVETVVQLKFSGG
ncbi:MAG: 23S rRNA (uracil(1939)-C(5))-methyltransferase RlmD [Desulfuromonadales bacterium]|nr:23S rRNA (uracil(1939)-C(5))-methyltransferase RlmD [Desulfuromonadales bacterium]